MYLTDRIIPENKINSHSVQLCVARYQDGRYVDQCGHGEAAQILKRPEPCSSYSFPSNH